MDNLEKVMEKSWIFFAKSMGALNTCRCKEWIKTIRVLTQVLKSLKGLKSIFTNLRPEKGLNLFILKGLKKVLNCITLEMGQF